MMDGFAQPTFSFAKFCAQFNQSWNVPVQPKFVAGKQFKDALNTK